MNGVFSKEAGVVRVQDALKTAKDLSIKQGATFRYSATVVNVDHELGTVTLDTGEVFKAKNIVLSCGVLTDKFFTKQISFQHNKQILETLSLKTGSGMPCAFLMQDHRITNGIMIYGTCEGEKLEQYKIGNEFNNDPHFNLLIVKELFPSLIKQITGTIPCFYSITENEEFIFEKFGKVVYAFGLNGRGFKHMMYHGKRVQHLIND